MAERAEREERQRIVYPLRLTVGQSEMETDWAELRLPTPLSPTDVERICRYVQTLVEPDAQP